MKQIAPILAVILASARADNPVHCKSPCPLFSWQVAVYIPAQALLLEHDSKGRAYMPNIFSYLKLIIRVGLKSDVIGTWEF